MAWDGRGPQVIWEMSDETIELSWTKTELSISISAETGSDANGNTFESAIDADTFDTDSSGPVTETTIYFEIDLGSLSVYSDIVTVAGEMVTEDVTDKAGNQDTLSNVKIGGTLPATDLGQ